MHEFGHTFDSRDWGFLYLFVIGLPSAISAARNTITHSRFWTEMRANRFAKGYFGKYYGVDWNGLSGNNIWDEILGMIIPGTIEDSYPTY